MAKSTNKNYDDIIIPEIINKPPKQENENLPKVDHPTIQNTQPQKLSLNKFKDRSRFAPQSISVNVPSKGFLYRGITNDPEVAQGVIKISQITATEEKIMSTQRFIENGTALDMILENCIQSDIDPYDLLSTDRLYLLFYLRGMSYGLTYDFNVKCSFCGKHFIQTVEINKLPLDVWETEEDAKEPVVIKLPMSNATVEAHFMRGREEKDMMIKSQQSEKSFDDPDDRATDSLIYLIDKITLDTGEVLGPDDRLDFINHMVGGDCDEFRTKITEKECGFRQLSHVTCPRCNANLKFSVPLGPSFFRRSRR